MDSNKLDLTSEQEEQIQIIIRQTDYDYEMSKSN